MEFMIGRDNEYPDRKVEVREKEFSMITPDELEKVEQDNEDKLTAKYQESFEVFYSKIKDKLNKDGIIVSASMCARGDMLERHGDANPLEFEVWREIMRKFNWNILIAKKCFVIKPIPKIDRSRGVTLGDR